MTTTDEGYGHGYETGTEGLLYFVANMSNMSESTTSYPINDNSTRVKSQFLLYDIMIPSIGAIIILLNLGVVISSGLILKKGQQPRATYLFLGNVALTDLITGIAVIFGQTFPREYRDHNICAVQIGMIVSSTLASVYSVGLIAVDRFLYILYGLQYQQWVYPQRARLMIALSWILGCIIGYLPLFGWYGDTQNGKICWFIILAPKQLITLTVCMGIIPIIVVVTLYSVLLSHALKRIVRLRKANTNSVSSNPNRKGPELRMFVGKFRDETQEEPVDDSTNKTFFQKIFKKKPSSTVSSHKKWKAIKVVLFTSSSFVITWSPYFITSLIYVYTCDANNYKTKRCKNISLLIASPLAILGFVNSLLNPIIYAWWHKGFRTYVKKRVSSLSMRKRVRDVGQDNSKNTKQTWTSSTNPTKSGDIANDNN